MAWLIEHRWCVTLGGSMLALVLGCSDDGVPAQAADTGDDDGATTSGPASTGSPTSDGMTGPGEGTGASGPGEDGGASTGPGDDTGVETTGSGEDTDGGSGMQCESDRDCMVVDDCCTCAAQHVDDEVPECEMVCVVGKCTELGIPEIGATCRFGTCVFDKLSCDQSQVVCLALPPECPDGHLPEVEGNCWAGGCVPAEACDVVPSCDDCPAHETCVELQTQGGPSYACEPVAPGCGGEPSCACMGEACPEPFDTCVDGRDGLQCSCPAC
jgi:hypothetical protein